MPEADREQLQDLWQLLFSTLKLRYSLPDDSTKAEKEELDADTAPRRLMFIPNFGGWRLAGQVSYRTFDTSQPPRPGSYFADLIVAKAPDPRSRDPEPAWSPCDVLQLWGVGPDRKTREQAGWWISSEDELAAAESEGPWKPIAPPSVAAVREPRPPLIDDDAAHRFLSADAVAADPLVPARWWAMPAERRRELVAHMLQATIQGPARGGRETVTIAAEPSVAAVLFYIVCRLLPRRIAESVSFSTYEADDDERPLAALVKSKRFNLVATTFLNEEAPTADLPPELAQRGFACNTFRDASNYGRCQPPPEQGYARRLIALAAANDWVGIESLLAALDAEGLKAADLDQLIKIDHLVTAYFGGKKPTGVSARRGPQEARFLRERFRGVLETQAATRADWPSDLVEAAIVCLEGDLENLWTAGGPVRALLEGHLPVDGDGLGRLLEPPQGSPSPPPALVAAAVVSATLRGKPPHLPSRFVKHCRDAREGRNRAAAVALLGAVIRGLPEDRRGDFLVGVDSASITDLLIDVFRNLSPPERDGLRPALTESLSNAIWKLTAKDLAAAAELLHRQADAASWTAASHPGLQEHLDGFFGAVLDDASREPGSHLVDAAGRSRVARLQQWTDHARDRRRIGETLSHWKAIHDAVTRLAADAPAWRSWAKPAAPEGREIPAAVAAIDGLRPFDVANSIKARERQQGLARTVVQTFKQAQPEGSDLRAGWDTVGHWLDQALAEEAERRAPGRVREASDRSAAATYGVWGGIAALIAVVAGLVAYSQGGLDDVLPEAWRRRGEPPPKVADSGGKPAPDSPPVPDISVATEKPAPPTPEPPQDPPLTAADVDLKLALDKGKVVVTWNHEKLKPRISDSPTLSWKGPKQTDHRELPPTKDGQATIDTKDSGFGQYEVKLSVTPSAGNGDPFGEPEPIELPAPPKIQLSDPAIVIDGKPRLRVKVTPLADTPLADEKLYGKVLYRLTGPADFSKDAAAIGDGTVVFDLPDDVTPANYQAQLQQFTLTTVVPQGLGSAVNLPPIPKPNEKQELLAILDKKQHITALADDPSDKKAQPLCDLPWSLGLDQFDLWLMTPKFKPGMSLTFRPKDTKTSRWPCNATVSTETGDQKSPPVLVGHFEVEAGSSWKPRLQFKPAENREKGHDDAYAALRCCRLCFVIAGQPVATSQLFGQSSLGPLKIQFPVPSKPISAAIPALDKVPNFLAGLLLAQSKPEPIKFKDLVLSIESGQVPGCMLHTQSNAGKPHKAAFKLTGGNAIIEEFNLPISLKKTISVEKRITDRENAIGDRNTELAAIKDGPTAETQRKPIIAKVDKATNEKAKDEQELAVLKAGNAFAEAVKAAEFTIDDWRIAWETEVAQDKSPLATEVLGGTAVVVIQGSPAGEPIVFKVAENPAPVGEQTADASEPPAE